MTEGSEHVKVHIEKAIDRARAGVSDRIDEIDRRLRSSLDLKQQAGEHAWQLMLAGATVGFIIGIGAGKAIVRAVQFGIPIAIAVKLAKSKLHKEPEG